MAVMGMLGVVIERFAYRPLRNAPRLAPLITAIGVSFILQNIIQIIVRAVARSTRPRSSRRRRGSTSAGSSIGVDQRVRDRRSSVVLMVALQLFVTRTRLGRAMRSTAQDREAAR